ncbi:hypothetical protein BGX30_002819 [Mortierella sp. GBA39]|nr:hypothetical protein BGX30_002819 [Mortierella sp. GBA39]
MIMSIYLYRSNTNNKNASLLDRSTCYVYPDDGSSAGLFKVVKESMPAMALLGVRNYDPSPEEAAALELDLVDDKNDYGYLQNPGTDPVKRTVHVQCCLADYTRDFKLDRST